jgi:hypothetical protein
MPKKEKLACVDEPIRGIFDKHVEGKLIEHWDEFNLLEVFQQTAAGDGWKRGGTMNHWMGLVSLVGILCTAVVLGTDMFFLTCARPALRLASSSAGTEVMGFFHMFGDARMPIWGVSAILSNLLLVVLGRGEQRWFYLASLFMLILFVIGYARLSKPINQIQTKAAKTGERLDNGRELQASWDRSLFIRVPLLVISLLAQCLVLLVTSA